MGDQLESLCYPKQDTPIAADANPSTELTMTKKNIHSELTLEII